MTCMKLGSRPGTIRRDGNDWYCTTGLKSDITVKVGEAVFHLHKFPLVSRSGLFETLIGERTKEGERVSFLELLDFPFEVEMFSLCSKFCYSFKFELNASNVIPLFCASDYLRMEEEVSEGNLKAEIHNFLHNSVLKSWTDSVQSLQSCNGCINAAKDLQILEHCVKSVAEQCFSNRPEMENQNLSWNGIQLVDTEKDWWYADVSTLPLPLFVEVISQLEILGMDQEIITGAVNYYAKRCIPALNRQENITDLSNRLSANEEQKILVEEIERMLPFQKGVSSCKLLFGLLRNAKLLNVNDATIYNLERRIGIQLDEADLEDILILSSSMSAKDEAMYDLGCVHRLLLHFLTMYKMTNAGIYSEGISEVVQFADSNVNSDALVRVSSLIEAYLAEVASDSNLKCETFRSLAAAIPDYARLTCDLLYGAIDRYLQAHPWLTDTLRESLCQLIDCQKLSLEACTHAVQNNRLPLRKVVQVLLIEQLQLRKLVTDHLLLPNENSDNVHPQAGLGLVSNGDLELMQARVVELEKEYGDMHKNIERLEQGRSHPGLRLGTGFGACGKKDDVAGSSNTR